MTTFSEKFAPLNKLGDSLDRDLDPNEFPDYSSFGFTVDDIPQLVEKMQDKKALLKDHQSNLHWSATHAARASSQIDSENVIQPLLDTIKILDELDCEAEWSEWPRLLSTLGEKAIPAFKKYIFSKPQKDLYRLVVCEALYYMTEKNERLRPTAIEICNELLKSGLSTDTNATGFVISFLIDLNAVESIDIIRDLYAKNMVDPTACGPIEKVEYELGLGDDYIAPKKQQKTENIFDNNDISSEADEENEKIIASLINKYADRLTVKNLSMLDGYFAAVICAKSVINPSKWFPDLWINEPQWDSLDEYQYFFNPLLRYYNFVAASLNDGDFAPFVYSVQQKNEVIDLFSWCTGFMLGYGLWDEKYSKKDEAEIEDILKIISRFAGKDGIKRLKEMTFKESDDYHNLLALIVRKLFLTNQNLFLREQAATARNPSLKVGRNDPCPCGSGKKFKKCCLH